jgi:hypothetical protein
MVYITCKHVHDIYVSTAKPTRCTSFSNLFYSAAALYMLRSFVHHQESKTVHAASGICQTDSADCLLAGTRWNFHFVPASKQSAESEWHIPDAACTVLDSWWCTERPSETCRVLLQKKINLRTWCISLVLLQKYITMHDPITPNIQIKTPNQMQQLVVKFIA